MSEITAEIVAAPSTIMYNIPEKWNKWQSLLTAANELEVPVNKKNQTSGGK